MKIKFENAQEYFGMAGPWLADCFLDDKRLKEKFLVDNFAFSTDNNLLVLSRYSDSPSRDREFRIIVGDCNADSYFISKSHYNALFIESINFDTIVFHKAFHDKNPTFREKIQFSSENFLKIRHDELFLSTPGS